MARTGARNMHQVIPDEWEWLTVLTYINASSETIPNFYIFRSKRFRKKYIQFCKQGVTMAMSKIAWMIVCLFSTWLNHFILALRKQSSISMSSPHLLILDGHSSHDVTFDVVGKARAVGLHLLMLPSHCSYIVQPLDVAIFKRFKAAFRVYWDAWMLENRDMGGQKEVLVSWTFKTLKRALTVENIEASFRRTGIHPLNLSAIESHMGPSGSCIEVQGEGNMDPSRASTQVHGKGHDLELPFQEAVEGFLIVTIKEVLSEHADIPSPNT